MNANLYASQNTMGSNIKNWKNIPQNNIFLILKLYDRMPFYSVDFCSLKTVPNYRYHAAPLQCICRHRRTCWEISWRFVPSLLVIYRVLSQLVHKTSFNFVAHFVIHKTNFWFGFEYMYFLFFRAVVATWSKWKCKYGVASYPCTGHCGSCGLWIYFSLRRLYLRGK